MKRFLIAVAGVAAFAAMAVAAGDALAFGHGSFKASNTTTAMFDFHVGSKGGQVRGGLWYMEGDREGIKHWIRMKAEKLECGSDKGSISYVGPCDADGKPAFAQVAVFDAGRNTDRKDVFKIMVFDSAGNEIYMAGGEVGRGNIVVRCK